MTPEDAIKMAGEIIDDAGALSERFSGLAEKADEWGTKILETVERTNIVSNKQAEILEDYRVKLDNAQGKETW